MTSKNIVKVVFVPVVENAVIGTTLAILKIGIGSKITKIGKTTIPMIQFPCSYQPIGNFSHFYTIIKNKIDEQHHRKRYADP